VTQYQGLERARLRVPYVQYMSATLVLLRIFLAVPSKYMQSVGHVASVPVRAWAIWRAR
jgi:hypothetical protein